MKRGRRSWLIAAGVVAAVALLLVLWPEEPEPSYQGKKLSEWLERYRNIIGPSGVFAVTRNEAAKEAAEAVRQMRADAPPILLRWLRYEQPLWRSKLAGAAVKLPPILGGGPTLANLVFGNGVSRSELALLGFKVLGPDARAAVPELGRLIHSRSTDVVWRVSLALAEIGRDGLPPLLNALTNGPHSYLAADAIGLIIYFGHADTNEAAIAVPVLAQCVRDKDFKVADHSAFALGRLGIEPRVAVPALAAALDDPRYPIRCMAARALYRFGREARSAVPALVSALGDSDQRVREDVTNALRQIAPEALTNGVANGEVHRTEAQKD